jgi:PAS domain S-box-containing protein
MKTFKKYSTVSGILLIILLTAGAAAYKNFLDLAEVNRFEMNNRITLKQIEIVLGKVTDAETGQRGYIITGNEDYLRPYHAAVATIDKDVKELRFMTKDNAGHQQMLDTLEPLIIEKLGGVANRINLRKNKGFDAAAREVRIGKGKDIMDKIRKTLDRMEEDTRKSMEQKRKEAVSQSKQTAYYILFGGCLAALIVVISSFITRKELIVRERAEEELKKYSGHLEVAVAEQTNELTKANKQLEMEIEEHKKTEERLKAASSEWRITFDSASELIIMLDIERKIIKANLATTRFLGKSFPEIIGKKCCELFHVTNDLPAACPFEKMITNGKYEEAEFYLSEKNTWIRVSLDPIFDDQGNVIGGIHIIRDITESKRSRDQLRMLNEELRNLADHLQTLREEERIIISRDIHDELGQKLSGLKFEMLYLKNMLSGTESNYHIFLEKIQSISKNIDSLINWSRDLMTRLRPSIIDDIGLEAALEWLIKDFQQRSQIPCTINIFLKDTHLNDKMSIAVFRICQECLTNIARHANATAVVVNLDENEERIILKIIDNGIGMTKEQVNSSKSFGLIGMRERAIVLGGDFIIMGEKGKGTRVTVTIPKSSMDMK